MSDWSWADFQRQEDGEPPQTISFTADEVAEYRHENPDDPDCEVLNLVMERDMHDRMRHLEQENARLRAYIAEHEGDDYDC